MQHRTVLGHMVMEIASSTGSTRLILVDLAYVADDPYAVQLTFRPGHGARVTWYFARELLIDGLSRAVGEGDVRIRPTGDDLSETSIALHSSFGCVLLLASSRSLNAFLDRTDSLVPVGQELTEQHIDAQLEKILRER
ncbi:SsgA family sporulation/cell division regulator [Kitasatospora sp. NPDC094011]|uniref:SsgA family sporulation/cell division regulator n=1 Tax=Kitasatospora sp. NPDC094011 TaxID=3364090 RepID=UPI003829B35A